MAHSFKETAHLKTDMKKYVDNYDRIFRKKKAENKKVSDEYVDIITHAIIKDYENSPYHEFKDYWGDHCIGWARGFKKDFWLELCKVIGKKVIMY